MKRFGIIGVGGYVAPRHLKAIQDTGNTLICALDKSDSVGILDSYFPEADFFVDTERFERFLNKQNHNGTPLDFLSICSPNYLHDTHIRLALNNGSCAICEKPLVLNPWNLDTLESKDAHTKIYTILQLRLHPSIIALKQHITSQLHDNPKKKFFLTLSYITSRGKWYFTSWKGDESKSGGIVSNIGIHFFDMLYFVFGDFKQNTLHLLRDDCASGILELENATIKWFLSINAHHLPLEARESSKRTFRSLEIDGEMFEFSDGFSDLHTKSYEEILAGRGFGINDAKSSIVITHHIRNQTPIGLKGDYHRFCKDL